jgi:hypothetical protein
MSHSLSMAYIDTLRKQRKITEDVPLLKFIEDWNNLDENVF